MASDIVEDDFDLTTHKKQFMYDLKYFNNLDVLDKDQGLERLEQMK